MNRRIALAALVVLAGCGHARWSDAEKEQLRDLRITDVAPAADPSNRYADDLDAAKLGRRFFFDRRFSANGAVSCATCHVPANDFQDGLPLARGVGTTARRTMPIAGVASSPWLFWDGRKDSLWAQALGPLESPVEHGGDRAQYVQVIATSYGAEYAQVFGALPELTGLPAHASPNATDQRWDAWEALPGTTREATNRVFANMGKAIAAYERRLRPGPSRLDRYVDAVLRGDTASASGELDVEEEAGLRLFIGKANCTRCHNGPRLTNDDFANTGVPQANASDRGRQLGAREVLQDEFNCLSPYSDARAEDCRELRALAAGGVHSEGAFKVPSLRNVAARAPYMHAGQVATLTDVIDHYDRAPHAQVGTTELEPLGPSPRERRQLVRFLETLSAPPLTVEPWPAGPVR